MDLLENSLPALKNNGDNSPANGPVCTWKSVSKEIFNGTTNESRRRISISEYKQRQKTDDVPGDMPNYSDNVVIKGEPDNYQRVVLSADQIGLNSYYLNGQPMTGSIDDYYDYLDGQTSDQSDVTYNIQNNCNPTVHINNMYICNAYAVSQNNDHMNVSGYPYWQSNPTMPGDAIPMPAHVPTYNAMPNLYSTLNFGDKVNQWHLSSGSPVIVTKCPSTPMSDEPTPNRESPKPAMQQVNEKKSKLTAASEIDDDSQCTSYKEWRKRKYAIDEAPAASGTSKRKFSRMDNECGKLSSQKSMADSTSPDSWDACQPSQKRPAANLDYWHAEPTPKPVLANADSCDDAAPPQPAAATNFDSWNDTPTSQSNLNSSVNSKSAGRSWGNDRFPRSNDREQTDFWGSAKDVSSSNKDSWGNNNRHNNWGNRDRNSSWGHNDKNDWKNKDRANNWGNNSNDNSGPRNNFNGGRRHGRGGRNDFNPGRNNRNRQDSSESSESRSENGSSRNIYGGRGNNHNSRSWDSGRHQWGRGGDASMDGASGGGQGWNNRNNFRNKGNGNWHRNNRNQSWADSEPPQVTATLPTAPTFDCWDNDTTAPPPAAVWDIPAAPSTSGPAAAWDIPETSKTTGPAAAWDIPETSKATGPAAAWDAPEASNAAGPAAAWDVPETFNDTGPAAALNAPEISTVNKPAAAWDAPSTSNHVPLNKPTATVDNSKDNPAQTPRATPAKSELEPGEITDDAEGANFVVANTFSLQTIATKALADGAETESHTSIIKALCATCRYQLSHECKASVIANDSVELKPGELYNCSCSLLFLHESDCIERLDQSYAPENSENCVLKQVGRSHTYTCNQCSFKITLDNIKDGAHFFTQLTTKKGDKLRGKANIKDRKGIKIFTSHVENMNNSLHVAPKKTVKQRMSNICQCNQGCCTVFHECSVYKA